MAAKKHAGPERSGLQPERSGLQPERSGLRPERSGLQPETSGLHHELKRGSAELLILALLEERQRHGYEIGQLIARRSDGAINFHITSLYPTLYRLEDRGLIEGRWVERAGQRRRRYYKLTAAGRKVLAAQRGVWKTFFTALNRVARVGEV